MRQPLNRRDIELLAKPVGGELVKTKVGKIVLVVPFGRGGGTLDVGGILGVGLGLGDLDRESAVLDRDAAVGRSGNP